ncbi:uncharacterized protein Pyn_05049 [Prunus yedoensis var. nudiflora]|uniref:Uncharacterized protein n=1 Tax=Prunus yedoensis var. nudiflora TaxID=2094558 RepID=A0A314U9Z8_PRUYE|nr:uncharacterized protein Pyn_05049 [Prunus yedoensis var. nudiflora]
MEEFGGLMEGNNKKGYAWAISAGLNAGLAAVSAKLITPQVPFPCTLDEFKTVGFTSQNSGLAGYFLFQEP